MMIPEASAKVSAGRQYTILIDRQYTTYTLIRILSTVDFTKSCLKLRSLLWFIRDENSLYWSRAKSKHTTTCIYRETALASHKYGRNAYHSRASTRNNKDLECFADESARFFWSGARTTARIQHPPVVSASRRRRSDINMNISSKIISMLLYVECVVCVLGIHVSVNMITWIQDRAMMNLRHPSHC